MYVSRITSNRSVDPKSTINQMLHLVFSVGFSALGFNHFNIIPFLHLLNLPTPFIAVIIWQWLHEPPTLTSLHKSLIYYMFFKEDLIALEYHKAGKQITISLILIEQI